MHGGGITMDMGGRRECKKAMGLCLFFLEKISSTTYAN